MNKICYDPSKFVNAEISPLLGLVAPIMKPELL